MPHKPVSTTFSKVTSSNLLNWSYLCRNHRTSRVFNAWTIKNFFLLLSGLQKPQCTYTCHRFPLSIWLFFCQQLAFEHLFTNLNCTASFLLIRKPQRSATEVKIPRKKLSTFCSLLTHKFYQYFPLSSSHFPSF